MAAVKWAEVGEGVMIDESGIAHRTPKARPEAHSQGPRVYSTSQSQLLQS